MALAGVAIAQQPNEEASPGKKKKQGAEQTQQTQPAQPKPNANVARPHATPVREHGAANEPVTGKGRKARQESATAQESNVSGQPAASATPSAEHPKKGMKGRAATGASATPAATAAAAARATPGAAASAAPSVSATGQQRGQANAAAAAKKTAPQQVQQIKQSRNRFRPSLTTRTIAFKEVRAGRVRSMKYSAPITRNGMTRVGIARAIRGLS